MKCILENKKQHESLEELYLRTRSNFYDISEFLYALDILFVLSIIDFDEVSGEIYYA
ncbi:ABC-three component system middle component 7 [Acinetobacter baumannii]|uniref:ABC-three component system middle component 7 n=1 Tax=Acinetobacter baumannii TaxID=470 RepID=UPI00338D6124